MSTRQCCLCSQIEGSADNDLIARMLPDEPYARRVMLENSSFAVIPSIAPLAPGHALVCPKVHVRSFAGLDRALYRDYTDLKERLCAALRGLYGGEIHLFEHGSAHDSNRVLCTVDHAHMHVVPLPRTCRDAVRDDGPWKACDASLRDLQRLAGGDEYVFYQPPAGVARVLVSPGREIESQYMSRLIAGHLGEAGDWGWRAAVDARAADETWRTFVASSA